MWPMYISTAWTSRMVSQKHERMLRPGHGGSKGDGSKDGKPHASMRHSICFFTVFLHIWVSVMFYISGGATTDDPQATER